MTYPRLHPRDFAGHDDNQRRRLLCAAISLVLDVHDPHRVRSLTSDYHIAVCARWGHAPHQPEAFPVTDPDLLRSPADTDQLQRFRASEFAISLVSELMLNPPATDRCATAFEHAAAALNCSGFELYFRVKRYGHDPRLLTMSASYLRTERADTIDEAVELAATTLTLLDQADTAPVGIS